jgi:RHS repeat-associated core domain
MKSITYPNFPGNNVAYTYGAPGAADNGANRVIAVTSEAGTEQRAYGPLGEVVKQTWTIASDTLGNSANSPEVYTTLYQFDTWNRLLRMTYPDGEVLTYAYDAGGLVTSAQGQKSGFTYDYVRRLEYDKFDSRAFMEAGNQVRTRYTYRPDSRRLANLTAGRADGNLFQNLSYGYDSVGNILNLANDVAIPTPNQFGGPTTQQFGYDDLYRLTHAEGTFDFGPGKRRSYRFDLAYDAIHNIVAKQQNDVVTQPSGTPITQKKTSYVFNYAYGSTHPHAPTHIGNRTYSYDANGNQLGWNDDDNGTRRDIVWDEENRIQSVFDNGHEKTYKYDDLGNRVVKRGPQGETVYVNQNFTIRNREVGTKHVFVGASRVVSKLMKQDKPGANPQGKTPVEKDLFFFHPDHLGSSNYITDTNGKIFEHLEYFPFGETWVEESTNTQRTPYLFSGKELDEETGLYYFGARYYDPRTSVWQSADPALHDYLDGDPNHGVFNSLNLGLYSYALLNPLKIFDPNGAQGLPTAGEKLLERGLKWLSTRGQTVSRHIAHHTHVVADKSIHTLFRRPNEIKKLVERVLKNPDDILKQAGGRTRFVVEKEFNRAIGKDGERILRVVMEESGKIITAYPVKEFARGAAGAAFVLAISHEAEAATRDAVALAQKIDERENRFDPFAIIFGADNLLSGEAAGLAVQRLYAERLGTLIESTEKTLGRSLSDEERAAAKELFMRSVAGGAVAEE